MNILAIAGLLTDAALGGVTLMRAFQEFQRGRDPGETPEQAAAEYVREMLSAVEREQAADDAIDAWLAAHAGT